jgi:alanine dehydrogenase
MSEVAGRLAIEAAAIAARSYNGGNGLLMGGVPGVPAARVVVLGGGVVGTHAARMAAGLGAEVTILDRSLPRLRALDELFQGRARTRFSTIAGIEEEIRNADVVIGSVLVPGASAPRLITREMLGLLRPRTVLVDVAIDQGGCFETSHATTHAQPTYEVDGIIHYCVANMPGSVPRTSSHALNNATLPYGLALADGGLQAIAENAGLRAGLATHRGKLTSAPVAESLNLPYTPAGDLLAA